MSLKLIAALLRLRARGNEMELKGGSNGQETASARAAPPPPALPWLVQLQLYIIVAVGRLAMSRSGTVNRRFFAAVDWPARASARPDRNGVRSSDVTVDASRGLWARVFSPPPSTTTTTKLPVLVYFHGGAFTMLSAASIPYDAMCRRLCRGLGAVVVSVNYRLAPEHRCPAAYDDGVDVLRYLASVGLPGDVPGVDLSRCFLAGDSAGGNIVHHVARRWTASSAGKKGVLRLAGAILIQPFFGGEARTGSEERLDGKAWVVTVRDSDWAWRAFLPEGADRNHPAAHVTSTDLAALADGFPPAMVVVGGLDPLQDWQRQYAGVLEKKGKAAVQVVEFDEAIHGFFWFPELPETGELTAKMKAFMESMSASSRSQQE